MSLRAGSTSLQVLRHSHTSLLLANGVDLATVSAPLGHSFVRTDRRISSRAIRGKGSRRRLCWDNIMQEAPTRNPPK
jgi:integrase